VADQHCRVTVVGDYRRVNLALPARAPIAEYVMKLARICGQDDEDAFPTVWSLAAPGSAPLPPAATLDQAGITDGQVLYLRDFAAGEGDEPVVLTLEEAVSDEADRLGLWAWTPRSRAVTTVLLGIVWLASVLTAAGREPALSTPAVAGALAFGVGIASVAAAALAARRQWPLPASVCLALALSAVPEFAFGSGFVAGGVSPAALSMGAAVGSLLALAAIPDAVTAAVAIVAVVSVVLFGTMSVLHAQPTAAASVIAVVLLALAALGPRWTGRLVASSSGRGATMPEEEAVAAQVRQARRLFTAWNVIIGVSAATDLVVLAASANWFAQGLAGSAALVLLLGAGVYRQVTEVVPNLVAGAAGLFTLALELPARLHLQPWAGPAVTTGVGIAIVATGLARSFISGDRVQRPRALLLVTMLRAISVALVFGVFGVFGHLQSLGHHL
jgi:type VII secretion integral membrane protein EccD